MQKTAYIRPPQRHLNAAGAAPLAAPPRSSAVPRWSHRDPVDGGNPFPVADARHETWDTATVNARQALLRFDAGLEATAHVTLDPTLYRAHLLGLAVGRFDVWARRCRSVVSSRDELGIYDRWLADYVTNWLGYVAETCPRVEVGDELRTRLQGRAAHWVAETRNALAL